ncbi:hypothetical protein BDQ17DRAFT_1540426 [Cyathus striatus]|nr:hypothetical protein BDQ17DRAFT_1540426 [Cyathus striatus]
MILLNNMIPLIPALVLAFISFIASAFIILRIVIPILPPHPLSKRVSPSEFGLPKFRTLSSADKTHLWLASLDLFVLVVFIWHTTMETLGGPSDFAATSDPAASVRLWIVTTLRQTCLLIIAAITLLHVRMGRSVAFGARQWMIWAPTILLAVTSTALAGVISGAGTLFIIKRNLTALNEEADPWPPVRQVEDKPRPSFGTEEIDAIRDGASWITSNHSCSSRRNSVSAWSFSTHHTIAVSSHGHGGRPQNTGHNSVPAKSSFWFGSASQQEVPPVPPLPSPYGPLSPTAETLADPDPFRRDIPSPLPSPLPHFPRERLGSQNSWLTSTGTHTTMTAWSYPASHHEGSVRNASTVDLHSPLTAVERPVTPALANAQVLGGYGYTPSRLELEKGISSLAAPADANIDVSVRPALGWFFMIWLPFALSLPYLIMTSQNVSSSLVINILFVLSVTLSSPLLAVNIIFGSPMPIPIGLFDSRSELPADLQRGPSPVHSLPPPKWSHEYKRSTSASITVVEGRRSGDVWLSKGDAIEGKSKFGRAVEMLNPKPKLSVLPPEEDNVVPITPPLPIQNEDSSLPVNIHNTPASETSAQFGRLGGRSSKASSRYSGVDDSVQFASRIMIAQRHYSALAQTVVVPAGSSPEKLDGQDAVAATSSAITKRSSHLRSRSVSSVSGPETPTGDSFNISPPPSFPLPPTPPNVRAARLAKLGHKKSFSSGFSFGPVDNMNEIDALTAGVLPLLVPGLKVGEDMKIVEGTWSQPSSLSKSKGKKAAKHLAEFGQDFSSPKIHSTPARRRVPQGRKESAHRRNHFSLPSLGLGKDGMHSLSSWGADIRGALEHKVGQYTSVPSNVEVGWRNTVFGAESIPNNIPLLKPVREEPDHVRHMRGANLGRAPSTRSLGLIPEVPHGIDTARSSVISTNIIYPPSAASTVTLFEDFEAGLLSGPLAESTPHNTVSNKPIRSKAPPMPKNSSVNRRSSIVYIKSDDHVATTNHVPKTTSSTAMASIAQWSSRAVRPLIPKASKLQRKISNSPPSDAKTDSPRGDRNTNTISDQNSGSASPGTRPLTLGKRQKTRMTASNAFDENSSPDTTTSSSRSRNLKPLALARSETSKVRGALRKSEVLPEVVVRPPSTIQTGYAYTCD